MNQIFFAIVMLSVAFGAWSGSMEAVSTAALASAKGAAELAIGLIGYMALFLGLMKVAEEGGLLLVLARAIRPLMVRLFPDVPPDHPAMGAMIMNIGSNMLGLGNAATPLGIKAMQELNKLNKNPGVATNAMVLFLAINTSGLALLPTGVVGFRARAGSEDPWAIVATTLFATTCSTVTAVIMAKLLQRLRMFALPAPEVEAPAETPAETPEVQENAVVTDLLAAARQEQSAFSVLMLRLVLLFSIPLLIGPPLAAALMPSTDPMRQVLLDFSATTGNWVIPMLFASILTFGLVRKIKVYEVFVRGAREGFNTGVMIIPYLVAILVAVGMLRASGGMKEMTDILDPVTSLIGMPAEVLPLALVRPLSGTGASGLMVELMESHGPDSFIGYLASTMQGSTDTTFYIIAVYFGAVGVSRARHAVAAGVSADIVGALASVFICRMLYGALLG